MSTPGNAKENDMRMKRYSLHEDPATHALSMQEQRGGEWVRYADNEMLIVVAESYAGRASRAEATLRFLRSNDGECIGDHPKWVEKIDEILEKAGVPI